jgi:RNA-directed DNA polymerase
MSARDTSSPPLLLSRADVASLLGLPLRELTWWVWALREDRRYDYFEIARRDGSPPRQIHAPIKPIKDIQQRLSKLLSDCYEPPVNVHGFVRGRSPMSNARLHQRQQWVLRLDLADFFPSIHFGRVRGLFRAYPFDYPADVATLLAQICCHDGRLPQGAPTSPIISNYICRRLDSRLAQLARAERCHYTRYADDLCFSTDRTRFSATLGSIDAGLPTAGVSVVEIIVANGFTVNEAKIRMMRRTQRQRITVLVVNRKVNVSQQYTRDLRNLLYIWQQHGEPDATAALGRLEPHMNWPPGKPTPEFRKVVRGRVQHVGAVKGWEVRCMRDSPRRSTSSTPVFACASPDHSRRREASGSLQRAPATFITWRRPSSILHLATSSLICS